MPLPVSYDPESSIQTRPFSTSDSSEVDLNLSLPLTEHKQCGDFLAYCLSGHSLYDGQSKYCSSPVTYSPIRCKNKNTSVFENCVRASTWGVTGERHSRKSLFRPSAEANEKKNVADFTKRGTHDIQAKISSVLEVPRSAREDPTYPENCVAFA